MHDVRDAIRSDVPSIGRTLADAFADDPVLRHLAPGRRGWDGQAAGWFGTEAVTRMPAEVGRVLVTPGVEGVAVWAAPDRWRPSIGDLVRSLPATVRLFRSRMAVAFRMLAMIERHHPRQPHWYLQFLGTRPEHQGRGVGGALLGPVLRRCDDEGLPAYLESSKESNLAFYARHGFEPADPLTVPGGGPRIWPMWRDPRPPDGGHGDGSDRW